MPASSDGSSSARPGAAALGCVIAALGLALIVIPAAGPQSSSTLWLYLAGAASLVLGSAIVAFDVRASIAAAAALSKHDHARFGRHLFDRHATNLAFFFMVVVVLVSVVTTMMLHNGQLAVTARDFASQLSTPSAPATNGKGRILAIVLVLSIALSWCGAGLYVVQRLEIKRDDPDQSFNFLEFFRGIWSRVGQANLYTLLFFLLIWANADSLSSDRVPGGTNTAIAWDIVKSYAWLPILGLLSGLLVKSAESVVFGLGSRILAAVSALLGSERQVHAHAPTTSVPAHSTAPPSAFRTDDVAITPLQTRPSTEPSPSTHSTSSETTHHPRTPPSPSVIPPAASPRVVPSVAPPTAPSPSKPTANGSHSNGTTTVASPAPRPVAVLPPVNTNATTKRESPFDSTFSVPTTVPAPSTSGTMSFAPPSAPTSAPARVVPVAIPAPTTIDVKPTIVPVAAPPSTSVMVNIERPEVPTLQDVVGPASNSKPQSSTTGIPQSNMWPALIRVVAPSRMTPNEPKILLPDLPEGD
jgi:hypothetical protein